MIKINRRLIFRAGFWICMIQLLKKPWTLGSIISYAGVMMIIDSLLLWCMEVTD
jgi:hypothetical protein